MGGTVEVIQAADDADVMGTSLFCFVVLTPNGVVPGDGVKEGYEEPLLWAVKEYGLGIFRCDDNAVFYGQRAEQADWGSIRNADVSQKEPPSTSRTLTTDSNSWGHWR